MTTLLAVHDRVPVAIVIAHGHVFTGYGATQGEALRDARRQAALHLAREHFRIAGLTLAGLSLLALALHLLT